MVFVIASVDKRWKGVEGKERCGREWNNWTPEMNTMNGS